MSGSRIRSESIALLLLAGALACTGIIGEREDNSGPEGSGAAGSGKAPGDPQTPEGYVPGSDGLSLPMHRIWRLTPLQYERSFSAAFGRTVKTAADFVKDPRRNGFDDLAAQNHVDIGWAERVQQNADEVAAELAATLRAERPCLFEEQASTDCVGALLDEYGSRAFRRPLSSDLRNSLTDLLRTLREGGASAEEAVSGVLSAIAQSPFFLYRVELGEPIGNGTEQLDAYTIASQLSYLFTDGPPDEALLDAAAEGRLLDRAVVLDHAKRLLETPEALQKVSRFFDQYLGIFAMRDEPLPKDPNTFAGFTADIQASMLTETDRFVERIAFTESGTLVDLFTSAETFAPEPLRAFYGWDGEAIGASERSGVFLQGSVLATHAGSVKTDALHRGLFIYERLLCQHIAPPPGVDIFALADRLDPPDPLATERERLEYLEETQPVCGGCHKNFVSLGLSLETFDAVGVHRETHNGRPIDTAGVLTLKKEEGGPYEDAQELFERISLSAQGQACFAENWVSYAFGGDFPVPMSTRLVAAFREHELRVLDLLLLVTQEDAFYLRRVEETP